jgi:hypothetical protein
MIPWRPISELPDTLKEGFRVVLLWDRQHGVNVGQFEPESMTGAGWKTVIDSHPLDDVTHFAEINAPQ